MLLGDERDADTVGTLDATLRWRDQTGEQLEQRALAAPVGPHQRHRCRGVDREVSRREREHVAEADRGSREPRQFGPLGASRFSCVGHCVVGHRVVIMGMTPSIVSRPTYPP